MNLGAPSWLVAWLQAVSVWDLILMAVAGAGIVVFIRRKGWRTVKAMARGILNAAEILEAVQGLPEFIQRTDDRLGEHTRQLKNSHDSNLRDDITTAIDAALRVEESVEGLHGRMDAVESQVTALARSDDEIRAEIENTQPPASSR